MTALSAGPDDPVPVGADAPVLDVMRTMRAMRRLRPDPVPPDLLVQLVEAATWAPSSSNTQLYEFVIVTDRAQMSRLGRLWREIHDTYSTLTDHLDPRDSDPARQRSLDALRYQAEHFDETPALIVACYSRPRLTVDPRRLAALVRAVGPRLLARLTTPRMMAIQGGASSYLGVQNLLLTARALGLAANITTWHLLAENDFKRVLGVPKRVTIYALIPIGWPMGRFGPVRRRPVSEALHWDHWDR